MHVLILRVGALTTNCSVHDLPQAETIYTCSVYIFCEMGWEEKTCQRFSVIPSTCCSQTFGCVLQGTSNFSWAKDRIGETKINTAAPSLAHTTKSCTLLSWGKSPKIRCIHLSATCLCWLSSDLDEDTFYGQSSITFLRSQPLSLELWEEADAEGAGLCNV